MITLENYVAGSWHRAAAGFRLLLDPATEEPIAQASSEGVDFHGALAHAREVGGPALRSLSFAQRGALLDVLSKALVARREELLDLSVASTGSTRRDAKFDIDGATATLAYYAQLGAQVGSQAGAQSAGQAGIYLPDGPGDALGRSARFYGQHVWVARPGVAVLVNAFNFPAWGFAEKMACALLAGMPVLVKPATSTAWVAERCARVLIESGALPPGAFSFVAGSAGDLLDHLGPQDVLAFTGSAATGAALRGHPRLLAQSVRVNIEADSLNAAVLAPDVSSGSDVGALFFREIVREMTQKSGQKCTAVRRILVPAERVDEIAAEIASRLGDVVTGDPRDESVTMGPLTTKDQLADAAAGVAALADEGASLVLGTGRRIEGKGAPAGKGYYFGPTLLRASATDAVASAHEREIFAPVATVIPYDGRASSAAAIVARGRGSLVTSVYSDDETWVGEALPEMAAWNGRVYLASVKMAEQAPGSGLVLALSKHGGPGRAGGGEELGGIRGVQLYMNRVALQGSKTMIERLVGKGPETTTS